MTNANYQGDPTAADEKTSFAPLFLCFAPPVRNGDFQILLDGAALSLGYRDSAAKAGFLVKISCPRQCAEKEETMSVREEMKR